MKVSRFFLPTKKRLIASRIKDGFIELYLADYSNFVRIAINAYSIFPIFCLN